MKFLYACLLFVFAAVPASAEIGYQERLALERNLGISDHLPPYDHAEATARQIEWDWEVGADDFDNTKD